MSIFHYLVFIEICCRRRLDQYLYSNFIKCQVKKKMDTSHHINCITSHRIKSYHITQHHITLHQTTSHHITLTHIRSHQITSHHTTSHHITLYFIIDHGIISGIAEKGGWEALAPNFLAKVRKIFFERYEMSSSFVN